MQIEHGRHGEAFEQAPCLSLIAINMRMDLSIFPIEGRVRPRLEYRVARGFSESDEVS
jgi:hypothetical protein